MSGRGRGRRGNNKRPRGEASSSNPPVPAMDFVLARLQSDEERARYEIVRHCGKLPEKPLGGNTLDMFPHLSCLYDRAGWAAWLDHDGKYDRNALNEFAATCTTDSIYGYLNGRVGGIRVDVRREALNMMLGIPQPPAFGGYCDEYVHFRETGLHDFAKLKMVSETLKVAGAGVLKIPARELPTNLRHIHRVVCLRLTPTSNTSYLTKDQAFLLYSLLVEHTINVGDLILTSLTKLPKLAKNGNYPFAVTLTRFLAEKGCELTALEDTPALSSSDLNRVSGAEKKGTDTEGDEAAAPPYMTQFLEAIHSRFDQMTVAVDRRFDEMAATIEGMRARQELMEIEQRRQGRWMRSQGESGVWDESDNET